MAENIVPGDVAKAMINMVTERSTAQERSVAYEHISNALYTERGRLVAFLASVYPSRIGPDPDDPPWFVVTIDTPTGQMCWHVSDVDRMDRHLFDHIRPAVPADPPWDGHTTSEKYERLAELILLNDAVPAAMAAPGPLRWKFDGGRGAMVDLNGRIVGYYTPSAEQRGEA